MDIFVLLCVFSLTAAEKGSPPVIKEQPSSVVARRNDPATLNCAASEDSHIKWYRDGREVVTSSQDSRSHRVLLPSGSLFFLRVTATRRENDAGTYWCVASNSHGVTRSHNATLTVATLAYDFQYQADLVVKISIGESVTLVCRPPKGVPLPEVTWLRDGKQVTNSSRISVTEEGDLTITQAVKQDAAEYVCRANNAAGTREASPTRLITMSPPWFKRRPSNMTVPSGVKVELECLADGSPTPTVSWRRVDGKILATATIEDQRLILQEVSAEDSGVYVCKAESEAGVVVTQATLIVLEAPELVLRPQHRQIMVGEEAKLQCQVKGKPEPVIFWRLPTLDRTAVLPSGHSSGHVSVSNNGSSLILREAESQDSGTYYCWGVSSGGGVSGWAEVVVVSALPPPIVGVGPKDLRIAPRSTATFPCEVVSGTTTATVTWWYRSAAHLPSHQVKWDPDHPRISLPENGALIIRNIIQNDAGIYTCQIEAETGSIKEEAMLIVAENANDLERTLLPLPPSKPRLQGLNQTAVRLSWLPNSQGGERDHHWYSVEHWRPGWSKWQVADAVVTQESCVIDQLTPGHTYTFLVRAVNTKGASFPSPWSDPITTRAPRDPSLTMEQVRQARRRLARPVVTLTATNATAADSVLLRWKFLVPLEDWLEGVLVYWVADGGSMQVATVLGTSSTSHLSHLRPNTHYTFFLVPFWRSIEGTPSNCNSLTTPEDVPVNAPEDVQAKQQEDGLVIISWSQLSGDDARGEVVGYRVTLSHNGSHSSHTVEDPWMEARDLIPGRIYTVRVAAITGAGAGPYSTPILLELQNPGAAEDDGGSVLYAPPQPAWLVYLLVPLVVVVILVTLYYLRRLRQKAPASSPPHAPTHCQDHTIDMYSDFKIWHPAESHKENSLNSTKLLHPDHLVNEYAEPRMQPDQAAEPYATTALLAPPSPHTPWRHHSDDSGIQVNWSAILPPPPACPPPDLTLETSHGSGTPMVRLVPAQYDNAGRSDQYLRPCDNTSEHTYEPYQQVIGPDKFLTFNSLQSHDERKEQVECHLLENTDPLRSNTH